MGEAVGSTKAHACKCTGTITWLLCTCWLQACNPALTVSMMAASVVPGLAPPPPGHWDTVSHGVSHTIDMSCLGPRVWEGQKV
jgi:hypothetical protein